MKLENKRIFISDLPETTTQDELKNSFKNYGNVISVEIKERKELGARNNSLFFTYINVEINDRSLQQCFKDFADGKWLGQRIFLQIARESFLDRLKREREETSVDQKTGNVLGSPAVQEHRIKSNLDNGLKQKKKIKFSQDESEKGDSSTDSKSPKHFDKNDLKNDSTTNEEEKIHNDTNEILDLVIKNNKGKTFDRNGLKIESAGKTPIMKIDKSKNKTVINTSEANLKRLQSLNNLKKAHKAQKSLIQQALSKIDGNANKKIIFDETENVNNESNRISTNSKMSLFDEELQEDDFEPNFEIKEQFQGEKGQKLLELQTKYKNDKRFVLDARFLDETEGQKETENHLENNEELSLEEEKKKEYEILEQVLGKKVLPKQHKIDLESQKKVMLRFDPTQPEHSKFELKSEVKKEKNKRKRENSETILLTEKKQEDKAGPEVSKEVFYKVTEELKDSLKEKQEFSLLSMFGKANEKEEYVEETTKQIVNKTNNFMKEKNPFRYDSSDDDDETDDIPNKEDAEIDKKSSETSQLKTKARNTVWSEPFFFTDDDYRLQEGVDFIEKISTKDDRDFTKLRRDLKEIVKAKVRNNQRKNRPFKKKLGGNKKKKMLRMKRALKR